MSSLPESSVSLGIFTYQSAGKVFGKLSDASESESLRIPSWFETLTYGKIKNYLEQNGGNESQGRQTILRYSRENETYVDKEDQKTYLKTFMQLFARTHLDLVEFYLKFEEETLQVLCSMFPNPVLHLKGKIETGPARYQSWSPYYTSMVDQSFNLKDWLIAMRDRSKDDHQKIFDSSTPSHILEPLGTTSMILKLEIIIEWPENYCAPVPLYRGTDAATKLLDSLYEHSQSKDFTIVAGNGAEIKCHSFVLEGQSPALSAMMSPATGMKESQTKRIEIKDISEAGVNNLLRYFYCMKISISDLGCDMTLELFQAAHKYEIKQLEETLYQLLLQSSERWFTPNSALELYFYLRHLDAFAKLRDHTLRILTRIPIEKLKLCERYQELSPDEKENLHWTWFGLFVPSCPEVTDGPSKENA